MTDLSPEAVEALGRDLPDAADFDGCSRVWFGSDGHKVWWRLDTIMEGAESASFAHLPGAVEALVAAAYDDAIAAIEPHQKADVKTGGVLYVAQKAIKMRTHINARAALDTLLASARREGMEKAAGIADRMSLPIAGTPYQAGGGPIAAAIREAMSHE